MGLFYSLCKNCDDELHWFLEAKKGIKFAFAKNTDDALKIALNTAKN